MSLEELEARHLVELGHLQEIFGAMGHRTHLVEKSASTPYHALLVRLESSALPKPLQATLTFYPVESGQVQDTLLLQYFIELPLTLDAAGGERVRELLPHLNNRAVLGHFGVSANSQTIHYRYVQALPKDVIVTRTAIADVFILVGYTPALFLETIQALAAGDISLNEAHAQIDSRVAPQ